MKFCSIDQISTCYSWYAIDAFAVRDFPQKRILIAVADYDEEAPSWPWPPLSFLFFTGHFTNKLQGDNWEEFWMTFVQVSIASLIVGLAGGVKVISMVEDVTVNVALKAVGAFLIGFLVGGVLMGLTSVILMNFIFTGNSIYTAALWGAKWDSYGIFFGVWWSAHAFIYNQQLAKEVTL